MMNWAEYEEEQQRPTIFPLLCWGASIAVVLMVVASLTGCAPTSAVRICYVELVGKTETGLFVEAQVCMTPEAYAESQK